MNLDPQYAALTQSVGLAELSRRTILSVTGPDRAQFLHSFTTNDVKRLAVGAGCEAFVTSPQGKTLGQVLIFCEADQYTLDTTPDQAGVLMDHFNHYVITEDVQFFDQTAMQRDLLVAGPKAAALLATLIATNPPVNLLDHAPGAIAGCPVTVRRVEYAGPVSYLVQMATAHAATVFAAIVQAGALSCESAALNAARLEAGVPLFGLDISPENLPQEVGRDRQAISFTKGCYLGQETIARIDAIGHVNRLLVGLKFAERELPPAGTLLLAADQPIGQVTSAAWSPCLNAPLALAYVRRSHAKKGTLLSSFLGNAEVVVLPLAGAAGAPAA